MTDPNMPNRDMDVLISLGDLHQMVVHCIERTHHFTRLDMGLEDITSVVSKEIAECMQQVEVNTTKQ